MFIKRLLIFMLTLALLAACGANAPQNGESAASSGTEVSDSASSGTQVPDGKIPKTVIKLPEGINADNYPCVDGSTANMPLMAKLYGDICGVPPEEAETMVQVASGTGSAWRNMIYDGADLLLVYEAPENIKAEMKEQILFDKLEIVPIGRDGLVFLVNAANPVDSLTREQLIDIYTGKITDWSQVGGESGPIAAFQRNQESGSQTLFLSLLMRDVKPMEPPTELRPGMMGALIDAVAEYDGSGGAIGFSVYYYAGLMYENPNLKLLKVDGVEPSAESIGGGGYPLVNDFYAVIRKDEPQDSPARILRDWLLTADGRQMMLDANYVPVS